MHIQELTILEEISIVCYIQLINFSVLSFQKQKKKTEKLLEKPCSNNNHVNSFPVNLDKYVTNEKETLLISFNFSVPVVRMFRSEINVKFADFYDYLSALIPLSLDNQSLCKAKLVNIKQ